MEQRELSIALRRMARQQGLCDEWFSEWKDDDDIDTLLDRYVRGMDFAIKNDYPPLKFCRMVFNKDDIHRHNLYLDDKDVNLTATDSGYYAFVGDCTGTLTVTGMVVVTVYVRHNSKITVKSEDGAVVFVRCYEHSDAVVENDYKSKIFKYNR